MNLFADKKHIPTVSICIPTYCGANYLGAAIESVLAQDFTDFELIICDDNSPDHTYQVVSQYQDNRIIYLKNPVNLGPEGNWNQCLALAKGKYFKLLPQDDTLRPDCLRRQVEVLANDIERTISLVFCTRHIVDHNQQLIMTRSFQGGKPGLISSQSVIKKCVRFGTNLLGEPGALLFRKSLAEEVGQFDGSISYIIDLDYWFRLLQKGDAFYIEKPLCSFRVATGSWSIDIGTGQADDFIRFIKRYKQKPAYQLTWADVASGILMAKLNNYLRLLFYMLYLRKK